MFADSPFKLSRPGLLASLLLSFLISLLCSFNLFHESRHASLDLVIHNTKPAFVVIHVDTGGGFKEKTVLNMRLKRLGENRYELKVPYSKIKSLILSFSHDAGIYDVKSAKLLSPDGTTLSEFQLQSRERFIVLKGEYPYEIRFDYLNFISGISFIFLSIFLGILIVFWMIRRSENQLQERWFRIKAAVSGHPRTVLVICSFLAVILSCYPVIFLGRSFVSPNNNVKLLYTYHPTLPGYEDTEVTNLDTDTGALMWQGVPFTEIQRKAIAGGSIPLWNRYAHCGDALLAQGISMFGDPLHFIPILGGNSAWSWDLKFLLAKFLFCLGVGSVVLGVFKEPRLAAFFCFLSAYHHFYFFIFNHMGFFVFSYAPWILITTFQFLERRRYRKIPWLVAWLVANIACFNGGHVEPAVILIFGLNLAVITYFLAREESWKSRLLHLGEITGATLLFLGLTAPVWIVFLTNLHGAYSNHAEVHVSQYPIHLLPGVFDDFYLRISDVSIHPLSFGCGFMIFLGFLYSFFAWRTLLANKLLLINALFVLFWISLIFRILPGKLIELIPLVNRIGHTHVDFAYIVSLHLLIQSALGFLQMWKEIHSEVLLKKFMVILLFTAGISLLSLTFAGETRLTLNGWIYFLMIFASTFLYPIWWRQKERFQGSEKLLFGCVAAILIFIPQAKAGMFHFQLPNEMLMEPQVRVPLDLPGETLQRIPKDHASPFRVTGLDWSLFSGYSAVYGLEDIKGCGAVMNAHYQELLSQYPGFKREMNWALTIQNAKEGLNLIHMLNVRYLVGSIQKKVDHHLPFTFRGESDLQLWENENCWPRAFTSSKILSYSNVVHFIDILQQHGQEPFIALQEDEYLTLLQKKEIATNGPASGIVSDYELLPNKTIFNVKMDQPGIVVLGETHFDGCFQASVDEMSVPVFRANHIFKGIFIREPGLHRVQFEYVPSGWRVARTLFFACATLLLLLSALAVIGWKRPVKSKFSGA